MSNYGQVESRLKYLKSIFVAYKRICNKSATWHVSAYATRNEYEIKFYFVCYHFNVPDISGVKNSVR